MAKATKADRVRKKLRPLVEGCERYEDVPTLGQFIEVTNWDPQMASSQYSTIRQKLWEEVVEQRKGKTNKSKPNVPANFKEANSQMAVNDVAKLAKLSEQIVALMGRAGLEEVSFTRNSDTGEAELHYQATPPPMQTVKLN